MSEPGKDLILAADIGGTKTYLGLFSDHGESLELVKEGRFVNSEFKGPEEVLRAFADEKELSGVGGACLAVACPVRENRGVLTNLDWKVDGEGLKNAFGFKGLSLINDLEAIGWSIDVLTEEDLFAISSGVDREGNGALVAPGTGLGEAILFWDGEKHVPSASEGGHTDFAPRNDLEIEFLRYLSGIYGHVSYERVLSGPGLENIYEFLIQRSGRNVPARLKERFDAEGLAPVVTSEAVEGTDLVCSEAMELFISILGAEAGNLALKSMAVSGVYIGGGIAPRVLGLMKDGLFAGSFCDKGRFEALLSEMPVRVILNDRAALFGAACYAAGLAESGRVDKRIKAVSAGTALIK